MSKAKNIIGPLPTKPAEVWSENRANPQRSKSRTFAESKFVLFQRQSNHAI